MRVTKYRTELDDGLRTVLVKEESRNYPGEGLSEPQKVAEMLNGLYGLGRMAEEHIYMVAFNVKCRPLGVFELAHGVVDACPCTPREVFVRALLCGASQIVIAHNHPSKNPHPSNADLTVCKRIKEAGEMLGVRLIDNLIVGGDDYVSFREERLL